MLLIILKLQGISSETIKEVHDWLHEAGIHTSRHRLSEGLSWLAFDVRL